MSLAALALVLFAGLAVGMTSIGGVLLVPVLSAVDGVPIARAVPAAVFAFLLTGAASAGQYLWMQRRALAQGRPPTGAPRAAILALQAGTLLGAAAGALSLRWVPVVALHLALAAMALGSGAQALFVRAPADAGTPPPPAALAAIGLAVGLGSAWTGTGGPILLLPILLALATPLRAAIAMALAVQIPIAGAASAVNWWAGQLDLRLGLLLAAPLIGGWAIGLAIASRMSTARLRQALGLLLMATGLWYGVHILTH
ncbi:TSUP family transporter [Pseudorhodoferax sp.]|uniref:TSUP family transporter n=1 Tax=Pseudorhodoferax sp. TaxID=1993553 RepID=UPI0039E642AC